MITYGFVQLHVRCYTSQCKVANVRIRFYATKPCVYIVTNNTNQHQQQTICFRKTVLLQPNPKLSNPTRSRWTESPFNSFVTNSLLAFSVEDNTVWPHVDLMFSSDGLVTVLLDDLVVTLELRLAQLLVLPLLAGHLHRAVSFLCCNDLLLC